jgi:peptidyl-dipeptidase Dcp
MTETSSDNPLLDAWTGPWSLPPFADVRPDHYPPAFEQALSEHKAEIGAIAADPAPPDFANTIDALERSGRALSRIELIFYNISGADANDEIEAIERDFAPRLARHASDIYQNEDLFRRIDDLDKRRADLNLSAEQARVLDRYHLAFRRAGAGLEPAVKARIAEIGEKLAALGTKFGQNVLADERAFTLELGDDDLAGLPDWFVAAAAEAAKARDLAGKYVVTLSRSSIEPFLQMSQRRDLREKAYRAFIARGEHDGATDNREIAAEMVRLRGERARLLGYETFAHFRLADSMAKTPTAAKDLLRKVWEPARRRALAEAAGLQEMIVREGGNFDLQPWDWRYYAEKRRKADFDIDESEIKPYFQLDRLIEAAFFTARKLFGLAFTERKDLTLYHDDCRAWEVTGPQGEPVALFIGDYFARLSKHSGGWMTAFREQEKLDGVVLPVIVNVMNFSKPAEGEACLLSYDDAHTLFHEFGHALHGLMSDVTYPRLSGTNVARDFVEFPSQLYEHWLEEGEILRRFARHHVTQEPMPDALVERLQAARQFNQGFATVEYTASALVDLDLHLAAHAQDLDVVAFERARLAELGMPEAIAMRHRTPHFNHIFSSESYSAGYYSYLWSEVLDADGFEAFVEAGDIFDAATAARLKEHVYAAGNRQQPERAYLAFRGHAPTADALLRKRGLLETA